jgi:ATP-dependent DNA helicase RecQ
VLPPRRKGRKARARGEEAGSPLFEALREKRRELAKESAVPPYVIFHDSTLREMAAAAARLAGGAWRVPGVGAAKLERYGAAFLEAIREAEHAPA